MFKFTSISIVQWLLIVFLAHCIKSEINVSIFPCSTSRVPKIVGGLEATKHELPFIVSLTKRGGHFCGATIINENWILTAGHCVCNGLNKFMKATQIEGVMGLHNITKYKNEITPGTEEQITKQVYFKDIVPHPEYDCANYKNDIALLRVSRPISFTRHIQPVCLRHAAETENYENLLALVSGWGWTEENQETGQRSEILRKADVKIWNNRKCENSYILNGSPNSIISENQLCAGFEKGGIDSCWADSGGPLINKDENSLIGIVSTGIGCGRPGLPGIYTRVSKYLSWIQSVMESSSH